MAYNRWAIALSPHLELQKCAGDGLPSDRLTSQLPGSENIIHLPAHPA